MHRNDTSKFLLYIEPKKEEKLLYPVEDDITKLIEMAFSKSDPGSANYSDTSENEKFREGSGWRGFHVSDCGEVGGCHDYRLQNGMIVNSLCVFYVRWYRNSIHENDWNKLKMLGDYYDVNINLPETFPYSQSSTKKDTRSNIKKTQDLMIEELSKNINKNILDKIKNIEYEKY
jgi:hypothetical protein